VYDLIPEKFFEDTTSKNTSFVIPSSPRGFDQLLLQQPHADRITRYKSTIREMFAKKLSLVIFLPTITDIEHIHSLLSFGISDYVVTFHSGLTDKQISSSLKTVREEAHPLLILTTPSLLPWTRSDLGLVVIEREHSQYYYTHGDKGYDLQKALVLLTKHSNIPLIRGSHMLSLESHLLFKRRDAHEVMPLHFRNDSPIDVISMHDENKSASPYLSRQTLSILHDMQTKKKGHYFLYAHRKGMYPTTVCSDCGTLFACPTCNRPYVLHKIAGIRTYVCHGCEHIVRITEDTTLSCKYCGGWRMQTLGIATTGIEEELTHLSIPIFVIDSEHTNTKTKAKKVYKEWAKSPYGVLIGTEMAHNMLEMCDGITILSLDSLFALPEYRTDEKILTLVTEMAEKINQTHDVAGRLILQTRLKKMPTIKSIQASSYAQTYQSMLAEREEFLLPPYYVVIKASFDNIHDDMRNTIEKALAPYTVEWYEAGRGITLLFIHIKEGEWANNSELRDHIKVILRDSRPEVNPLHFFI
jgi:primosomal protein N' (replication factor Y)